MTRPMRLANITFALVLATTAASAPAAISAVTHHPPGPSGLSLLEKGDLASMAIADTQRLVIRSLDGKPVRQIPLIGESNHVPVWSPDGKWIAFQVRDSGRNMIALVKPDGGEPRVFHDAASATGHSVLWSPNSRIIGFLDPERHAFNTLNILTGQIRTVSTDPVARVGVWMWRPDGRSIAAVMTTPGNSPGLRFLQRRVDEIALDGTRRTLLSAATMQGVPGVTFIDAYTIFWRSESEAYRVPLNGDPPHRLLGLTGTTRPLTGVHTTAPATDDWAGLLPGDLFVGGQIELISARTGERRVIDLPFRPFIGPSPEWTPDGRGLLVAGWPPLEPASLDTMTVRLARGGDTTTVNRLREQSTARTRLYLVPVDGDTPVSIADFDETDGWTSVSPDGRFVAYGVR